MIIGGFSGIVLLPNNPFVHNPRQGGFLMKLQYAVALAFLLMMIFAPMFGQTPAAAPSPVAAATPSAPATQTSAYTLPPDKLAKSKALYDLRGTLRIVGTVWSFVTLLAILYFGVVARYRDWAEKISKSRFVQGLVVIPLFVLTLDILDMPLVAYQQSISRRYGLSVQGWGSWFGDALKGELITLLLSLVLLGLMMWVIRNSPRRWWFYFWLIALPILFFVIFISPYVIDPLFNKFEPLDKTNPELVTQIERVTSKGGLNIPRDRMFLMKASEKVTTLNAYVTGFGPSKRVVVWDTTIQKASTPETLFVFGHEMGHYVLNHVVIGLCAAAAGLFIGLFLVYRLSGWFLNKFGARWQIRELGDWAALPMIFLIFSILSFIAQPIGANFSRQLEHNADIYGLEVTHGINANPQESAAHAFQVLGELSLSYPYPSPLVVFWYYDHPSIPDRVRFAHQYDPWGKGEQPKYVK
jgi:STE24 endopeptidase